MLPKADIENLINDLQTLYDGTTSVKHKQYYSKLALLELSGWFESAQDEIAHSYGKPKLSNPNNIKYLEGAIIKKTSGCTYESHFKDMLIRTIGIVNLEVVENIINNNGDLGVLIAQLNTIWELRKPAAHTTIAGVMSTYNSPSTMIPYLNLLYPIFKRFETELASL